MNLIKILMCLSWFYVLFCAYNNKESIMSPIIVLIVSILVYAVYFLSKRLNREEMDNIQAVGFGIGLLLCFDDSIKNLCIAFAIWLIVSGLNQINFKLMRKIKEFVGIKI